MTGVGRADLSVDGRVGIVTGAATGIGRGLAQGLAAHGMRLVLGDVAEGVHAVAEGIHAEGGDAVARHADVTSQSDVDGLVEEAVDRHGRLDLLVNNAAVSLGGPVLEFDVADWERTLNVNLTGAFRCAQAAARAMAARTAAG